MNRLSRCLSCLGLGLGLLGVSATAQAQQGFRRPGPLPAFGRDPVGNHDTTAAVTNPSLLGFLPGAEFRWSSAYLDEQAQVPWQGHALAFGFPIPFLHLGTALRLDMLAPPEAALLPRYQMLTWALGVRLSDASALGLSWQRSYSETAWMHGLSSWSFGWTGRPWNQVGLGVTARAVNSPSNSHGGELDPAWDVALSIRPLSNDWLQIGLQSTYVLPEWSADYWMPRLSAEIGLPSFGALRADLTIVDPDERALNREWLASLSLVARFDGPHGGVDLAGGTLLGNGLGRDAKDSAHQNITMDLALRSWRETASVKVPHFALNIRIDETPNAREHVALLRQLWDIAEHEPAIDAVVLLPRAAPADGTARTQELRDAISYLRAKGKKVICHLDDAGGPELYLCSAADRILIHPAGSIRYSGMSSTQFYFKGLFEKLGVRADFVRIGEHKSAPESLTREGPTEVARQDRERLLREVERQWLKGVAEGRRLSSEVLAARVAKGPFVSSEAKLAGLVDDYAYEDEIDARLEALLGRRLLRVDEVADRAAPTYGAVRRVALVYVDGDMVDGRSQTIPLIDTRLAGARTLSETLRDLRADPGVAAVVLRVESPGGSALAADTLWREIQLLQHEKPVVVSMGATAASGGYYVASPAERIFANPASITGSIGVFYGKVDVAELLRKIGVSTDTFRTAPHADGESMFRPYTDDEREELRRKVAQYYDVFLTRVAIGRRLDKATVDRAGQGQVFTGTQAVANRLVDELGGLRQALAFARARAGLPETSPVEELPPPDSSVLGALLGLEGVREPVGVKLPAALLDLARGFGPFVVHRVDRPFARLEWIATPP